MEHVRTLNIEISDSNAPVWVSHAMWKYRSVPLLRAGRDVQIQTAI